MGKTTVPVCIHILGKSMFGFLYTICSSSVHICLRKVKLLEYLATLLFQGLGKSPNANVWLRSKSPHYKEIVLQLPGFLHACEPKSRIFIIRDGWLPYSKLNVEHFQMREIPYDSHFVTHWVFCSQEYLQYSFSIHLTYIAFWKDCFWYKFSIRTSTGLSLQKLKGRTILMITLSAWYRLRLQFIALVFLNVIVCLFSFFILFSVLPIILCSFWDSRSRHLYLRRFWLLQCSADFSYFSATRTPSRLQLSFALWHRSYK